MIRCTKGHEARVVSTRRELETVEDIGYTKERIKHFDREGSEFWAEIDVPVLVERTHEVEVIVYACNECGEERTLRRSVVDDSSGSA